MSYNPAAHHVQISETDQAPNAPQLSLQLRNYTQEGVLWTTLPLNIEVTLKRAQDGHQRPCIFEWSPTIHGFSSNGLVLLHHNAGGDVIPLEADRSGLVKLREEDDPMVITGYNHFLWELKPGQEVKCLATLPERYHKLAVPGESYTLLWPGGEIPRWDWGTIREHLNQELWARSADDTPSKPRLVLPGGPRISFEAQEHDIPWPGRALHESKAGFSSANLQEQRWRLEQHQKQHQKQQPEPLPIDASERIPKTPVLSVRLESPSTVSKGSIFDVIIKVTHEASSDSKQGGQRPVIFHNHLIKSPEGSREGYFLYHRRGNSTEWGAGYDPVEGETGFMIVDDPDISVRPAEHKSFTCLRPGESWVTQTRLHSKLWSQLPKDLAVGDTFRYRLKGATVEWWDWGSEEEHSDTVVKLPCFIAGKVTDPKDNGGRPELVVPASNVVEFTVVE